jgi:hypothetical protein
MFEPADNIDLLAVVQEWEEYYEMRFARKPKLVRAHMSKPRPGWPRCQRRRKRLSGGGAEAPGSLSHALTLKGSLPP